MRSHLRNMFHTEGATLRSSPISPGLVPVGGAMMPNGPALWILSTAGWREMDLGLGSAGHATG